MNKLYTDWSLKNLIGTYGHMDFRVKQCTPSYRESVFTFNEPGIINGSISTFASPNLDVSMIDMELQQDVVFNINDSVERAGSSILLKGDIRSDCIYNIKQKQLPHSAHLFLYSHSHNNNYTVAAGDTSILYLNLKPGFLQSIIESDERIGKFVSADIANEYCIGENLNTSSIAGYQPVLQGILNNNFTGPTRHIYMEAKALELFSMELDEMLSIQDIKPQNAKISIYDREKLHALHTHICQNYPEPLTFSGLVTQFGLNDFKLKKGYKQLFNNTVFGHIYQLRMQQAHNLLLTGEHNVSEVTYMVGYNNPYNFSTAFCRMFGYPPSRVLRRVA